MLSRAKTASLQNAGQFKQKYKKRTDFRNFKPPVYGGAAFNSRSRVIIGQVTLRITLPVHVFLKMLHWNKHSVSNEFQDIKLIA